MLNTCWSALLVGCLLLAPCSHAQSKNEPTAFGRFEVATIKRTNLNCLGGAVPPVTSSGGRLTAECVTLEQLIRTSYTTTDAGTPNPHSNRVEVSGGPEWVRSDYYSINAKAEGVASVRQMMGPMTRALIEDRFKLKIHRTEKPVPVYLLTVAKRGPKLQRTKGAECTDGAPKVPVFTDSGELQPAPPCGGMRMRLGSIELHGMSMDRFAALMARRMDRDVINSTGLEGEFNFRLEFTADSTTPGFAHPRPDQPPGPSIFSALEAQLGLKLQSAKGTASVLVIDQVERPSEN
jgi:uncharacterized protein (TIGR03435 family)